MFGSAAPSGHCINRPVAIDDESASADVKSIEYLK
jgi:hypothetical protein